MTRGLWAVVAAGLLFLGTYVWIFTHPAGPLPYMPVRYEGPTARDQRTYCEQERQDSPCQLGAWVSCPPECDRYQELFGWVLAQKAERINAYGGR